MAVHLRLTRRGTKKRPFYRVVAADSRRCRDGKFLDIVGVYDPLKSENQCVWKSDKVKYWLANGAQPTQTVSQLLRREPIEQ